jgi:predicted nucleic acid-binding protein
MEREAIAIVDTSFWIHLIKIDLLEIFLKHYSKIIIPSKVLEELTFFESFKYKVYIPEDIKEFKKLKEKKVISIKNPKKINKELESQVSKKSGELSCIALSLETGYISFIDNGRPYNFCKKNNILVSNIIEFILFLYFEKKITKKEIFLKIKLIERTISKEYFKEIENYLK